ncbi:MAG: LytTR family transcriptional regulator DNA-binding domain-containing protein [Lepagella sp.]
MNRLCLNSRDELIVIRLDQVAYLESNGNYSNVVMIGGTKIMLTFGLGKMEQFITNSFRDTGRSYFVRLGRKFIINQKYLFQISVPRQRLVLSDMAGHSYTLSVSKTLLRNYKELMRSGFERKKAVPEPEAE